MRSWASTDPAKVDLFVNCMKSYEDIPGWKVRFVDISAGKETRRVASATHNLPGYVDRPLARVCGDVI